MAALPSGLTAELPDLVAEATSASQFRDTRSCFAGEPLLFAGGAAVRFWVRVTRQSDHACSSPNVVTTTGEYPAALAADCASLYFFPATSGAAEVAEANGLSISATTTDTAITVTPRLAVATWRDITKPP
jgi:hypothetical protein